MTKPTEPKNGQAHCRECYLITVPHAICPPRTQVELWRSTGDHACDVAAPEAASMLAWAFRARGAKAKLMQAHVPRTTLDMNRSWSRSSAWRTELDKLFKTKVACVFDVHSFPSKYTPFAGKDIVLMCEGEPEEWQLGLRKHLRAHEFAASYIARPDTADIVRDAHERGIPAVMLEFSEGLDVQRLGKAARSIARYIASDDGRRRYPLVVKNNLIIGGPTNYTLDAVGMPLRGRESDYTKSGTAPPTSVRRRTGPYGTAVVPTRRISAGTRLYQISLDMQPFVGNEIVFFETAAGAILNLGNLAVANQTALGGVQNFGITECVTTTYSKWLGLGLGQTDTAEIINEITTRNLAGAFMSVYDELRVYGAAVNSLPTAAHIVTNVTPGIRITIHREWIKFIVRSLRAAHDTDPNRTRKDIGYPAAAPVPRGFAAFRPDQTAVFVYSVWNHETTLALARRFSPGGRAVAAMVAADKGVGAGACVSNMQHTTRLRIEHRVSPNLHVRAVDSSWFDTHINHNPPEVLCFVAFDFDAPDSPAVALATAVRPNVDHVFFCGAQYLAADGTNSASVEHARRGYLAVLDACGRYVNDLHEMSASNLLVVSNDDCIDPDIVSALKLNTERYIMQLAPPQNQFTAFAYEEPRLFDVGGTINFQVIRDIKPVVRRLAPYRLDTDEYSPDRPLTILTRFKNRAGHTISRILGERADYTTIISVARYLYSYQDVLEKPESARERIARIEHFLTKTLARCAVIDGNAGAIADAIFQVLDFGHDISMPAVELMGTFAETVGFGTTYTKLKIATDAISDSPLLTRTTHLAPVVLSVVRAASLLKTDVPFSAKTDLCIATLILMSHFMLSRAVTEQKLDQKVMWQTFNKPLARFTQQCLWSHHAVIATTTCVALAGIKRPRCASYDVSLVNLCRECVVQHVKPARIGEDVANVLVALVMIDPSLTWTLGVSPIIMAATDTSALDLAVWCAMYRYATRLYCNSTTPTITVAYKALPYIPPQAEINQWQDTTMPLVDIEERTYSVTNFPDAGATLTDLIWADRLHSDTSHNLVGGPDATPPSLFAFTTAAVPAECADTKEYILSALRTLFLRCSSINSSPAELESAGGYPCLFDANPWNTSYGQSFASISGMRPPDKWWEQSALTLAVLYRQDDIINCATSCNLVAVSDFKKARALISHKWITLVDVATNWQTPGPPPPPPTNSDALQHFVRGWSIHIHRAITENIIVPGALISTTEIREAYGHNVIDLMTAYHVPVAEKPDLYRPEVVAAIVELFITPTKIADDTDIYTTP